MKKLTCLTAIVVASLDASAQSTMFTYQGRLNEGGDTANGIYDMTFALFSVPAGGSPIAGPRTNSPISISNGLFTVTLDFSAGVFDGADRWLEIGVRTSGSGGFTTLVPRQPITSAPYAFALRISVGQSQQTRSSAPFRPPTLRPEASAPINSRPARPRRISTPAARLACQARG